MKNQISDPRETTPHPTPENTKKTTFKPCKTPNPKNKTKSFKPCKTPKSETFPLP